MRVHAAVIVWLKAGLHLRSKKAKVSDWDAVEATPSVSQWDATPGRPADATPGRWDATPTPAGSRWDATPGRADGATPARKNRWDETPTPGRVSRRMRMQCTLHIAPPTWPGSAT